MSVTGDVGGLNRGLLAALEEMSKDTGIDITVTSGRRTRAEQAVLYQRYVSGNGPVAAPPGESNHETGDAADISPGRETFRDVAGDYGLAFTVDSESWHIELTGGRGGGRGQRAGWSDVIEGETRLPTLEEGFGDALGFGADKAADLAKGVVGLIFDAIGADGARILLYLVLVLGGAALAYMGLARMVGLRATPAGAEAVA